MPRIDELMHLQEQPLKRKIVMTQQRIREWVNYYGIDGVYISFSGGKDSTVLLDIARKMYPTIKAVFIDVPTQYPELRSFAQKYDNIDIIRPKISFMEVCNKYGFPLISKEVSGAVYGARSYLKNLLYNPMTVNKYAWAFADVMGVPRRLKDKENPKWLAIKQNTSDSISFEKIYTQFMRGGIESIRNSEELASILNRKMVNKEDGNNQRLAIVLGMLTKDKNEPIKANLTSKDNKSDFSKEKYRFFLEAPFEISDMCCKVMKKKPAHDYAKNTKRMPITAQMAEESQLRAQKWSQNGCNAFDLKNPISNPMAFWTEQDILAYIVLNDLEICSVYGDIVEDYGDEIDGQMCLADYGIGEKNRKFKCTGCRRTGCMLCGFGCHLEKDGESRFQKLHKTHPKMYALLDIVKNNGVTFREAIEWTNEHGNLKILL